MTLRGMFNDLMLLNGVENPDYSSASLRQQVLASITAACQIVQSAGEDYFCREEETVALTVGTSAYDLDKDIQRVLGEGRLSTGQPVRRIESRSHFNDFAPLYLGQASRTVENGTPLAMFIESMAESDAEKLPDSVKIKAHVLPAPAASGLSLILTVIKEVPAYDAAALCDETVPPIPHAYHQTILLPIARYLATSGPYFKRNRELLPRIAEDYNRALSMLGISDPRTPRQPKGGEAAALVAGAATSGGPEA